MNKLVETLAMRKELLQARSAVYRVKMHQDIMAINDKLSGARAAIVSSRPITSIVTALALQYLGHSRLATMLSWAGKMLMVLKVASVVIKLYQSRSPEPTEPALIHYPSSSKSHNDRVMTFNG